MTNGFKIIKKITALPSLFHEGGCKSEDTDKDEEAEVGSGGRGGRGQ